MNLKNIAIIMDGNGRWAKKNNLQIKEGHARGVSALKEIVKESCLLYTSDAADE